MKQIAQNLLCLLCFSAWIITGCQKQDSDPQNDPNAIFTLSDSEAACANSIVNGNFIQGKPSGTNENIQLEIVASKTGKWSLSSDTLNGISFSGSGNFSDTGKHIISLTSSGVPANTGNYLFSITKGLGKRSVTISVLPDNVITEAVPLKSYFKGVFDGVQYYTEAPTIGPNNITYGRGGIDTVSFSSFVNTGTSPTPPGTANVSLQKGFLNNFSTSTEIHFRDFFKPGAYPFSAKKCSNLILPGIIFFFALSNTEIWSSSRSSGDQTGSSFTIVGIEEGHDNQGHYFVKVKSKFNCRLYNQQGQMKELKDAEMVSFFKK